MNKLNQTFKYASLALGIIASLSFTTAVHAKGNDKSSVKKPKLILQITVDQLRGDLPFRYQDRFVENGFNYLLNKGTVYRDAHHGHANTETIVGHVSLATGTHPSGHGLVGNIWYDRQAGTTVYNIEDAKYKLLTKGADIDKETEIDPTQKQANVDGRSPNTIAASTFSDEMLIASNGKAKVFGVSVKDRGAVAMAGHGGKAIWFSKPTQEFVSTDYYYQQYPQWMKAWNSEKIPATYANKKWQLLNKKSSYLFAENDDNAWEADIGGYGKVFPHPFGDLTSPYFSTLLTISPVGDELTADFAKKLIVNEAIGQDDITDYLALSFSSTDYIGHFYGMSSLESEDNLLRLDRTLADLFSFIDKKVGLENTVIVLSADHGGPEAPGYLQEKQLQGQYVTPKAWDEAAPIAKVKKSLGIKEQLISGYHHPYIYLDHAVVAKHKLDLARVQNQIATALLSVKDVYQTVASNRIENGQLSETKLHRAIVNNYYPSRSGDVYIVFKPQDFINDLDGLKVAVVHGSPWSYDTFVPIIFAGMDIPAQHIYQRVETIDVAPTLSAIMKIKMPSASEGKILEAVIK
jgi:predicted AlkP superfamily pyrophosphatase or phosphodiesterase